MDANGIAKRLNRVVENAAKDGYRVIYNDAKGCLLVVTAEEARADDLRELDGPSVELRGMICGTPILSQRSQNGDG